MISLGRNEIRLRTCENLDLGLKGEWCQTAAVGYPNLASNGYYTRFHIDDAQPPDVVKQAMRRVVGERLGIAGE